MSTVPRARLYILSRAMSAGSAHVPSQFARAVTRAVYGKGNSRALPGMLAIVLCFGARRCRESKRAAGGATTPPYSCSRAGQKADLFDVAKLFLQDLANERRECFLFPLIARFTYLDLIRRPRTILRMISLTSIGAARHAHMAEFHMHPHRRPRAILM